MKVEYQEESKGFNSDAKSGFASGVFSTHHNNKYLRAQTEVLFLQKGLKAEGLILGSEYEFTATTTYLEVLIQIAFKSSEFLTIAPEPPHAYLLIQKEAFNSTGVSGFQEQKMSE